MTDFTYHLAAPDSNTLRSGLQFRLVRDGDDPGHYNVDMLVASGDCFVTLATILDELTDKPYTEDIELLKLELEKTIHALLHLQRHYKIVRKQPDYNQ